jgi:hypothetical protein
VTGAASGVLAFTNADVGSTQLGQFFIKHVRWVGGTTSAHTCVLKTSNGDVIWESVADGAQFIDVYPFWKFFNGINVFALDSGTLYVTLA